MRKIILVLLLLTTLLPALIVKVGTIINTDKELLQRCLSGNDEIACKTPLKSVSRYSRQYTFALFRDKSPKAWDFLTKCYMHNDKCNEYFDFKQREDGLDSNEYKIIEAKMKRLAYEKSQKQINEKNHQEINEKKHKLKTEKRHTPIVNHPEQSSSVIFKEERFETMKLILIVLSLLPIAYIAKEQISGFINNKFKKSDLNKSNIEKEKVGLSLKTKLVLISISLILFSAQFGLFYIGSNETGHANYKLGKTLNPGQIIALKGQRGKQAEVYMPGWNYNMLYPWFIDIKVVEDLVVEPGKVAILTAADGKLNSEIVAPRWPKDIDNLKMITDYKYFLKNGGTRGVQQLKLTTGTYKLNRYQWNVSIYNMIKVETGEVLVYESIFGESPNFVETTDDEILAVPLVKSNIYRGIVDKPYPAGIYGINPFTEKAVKVPVSLQTFIYKGGYTSKKMEVLIDPENDKLSVEKSSERILSGGDGSAFAAKTKDNHTVYIGVRVIGQVEPIQAPRFAGTIKDIKYLDDKIIEPYTKNILMNIVVKYTALELKNKREEIGKEISLALRERTKKTGFRTKTVEITDLDIPPIVLISGKIESASKALKPALIEKQKTVEEAIKVQNLQQQANMQQQIADAQVKKAAAVEKAYTIRTIADANYYKVTKEAEANNYKVKQEADAAKYLAEQVGKEVVGSILLQKTINENADKFKVPSTLFISGDNSGNAKDIISAHMISNSIKESLKIKK